jgi:PEGA domain
VRAATVATAVLLSCAVAAAREPRMAIAPVLTGQTCPAELQRALADELPRTLARAGFDLLPPNEVDMRIGERPEFLQCHAGGCLAEEASFLRVRRLALPRLERASDGFTVGMSIYDVGQKRAIADAVERVSGSNAAAQLQKALHVIATRLHAELSRPGRLEVSAQPAAAISVDGVAKGQTPWAGELPPGDHVVALESGDARVERDVEVSPAQTAHLDISLAAPPPVATVVEDRPRHRALRSLAWSGLVVGVVAAGAGAALLALDGHGTCSLAAGQRECRQLWDTMPAGIALTAGGGALAIGSIVLLATERKRP